MLVSYQVTVTTPVDGSTAVAGSNCDVPDATPAKVATVVQVAPPSMDRRT